LLRRHHGGGGGDFRNKIFGIELRNGSGQGARSNVWQEAAPNEFQI